MAEPNPASGALNPPPADDTRPPARSLEERARRIGHHVWLEMRLFEVLGGWVAGVPEPTVKACLASHSHHHAWHAELWREHLPAVPHLPVDELVVAPNTEVAAAVEAVGAPGPDQPTLDKLVGVYRVVLPRVITAYAHDLETASPVSDAPLVRTLRFLLDDEMADWRRGEQLVQSLARTPEAVERAAARHAHLETLLASAGA